MTFMKFFKLAYEAIILGSSMYSILQLWHCWEVNRSRRDVRQQLPVFGENHQFGFRQSTWPNFTCTVLTKTMTLGKCWRHWEASTAWSLYFHSQLQNVAMSRQSSRGPAPPPPVRPNSSARGPPPPPPTRLGAQSHSPSLQSGPSSVQRSQSYYSRQESGPPEGPLSEGGKWVFHSQAEFAPPPPFERNLKRYQSGAATGCCKWW